MKINLSKISDRIVHRHRDIPQGWHDCRVAEVRFRTDRDGETSALAIRLEVDSGPHAGETVAWDTLNLKGPSRRMARTKRVLRAMGLDVALDVNLPDDIIGKRVRALSIMRSLDNEECNSHYELTTNSIAFFGYASPEVPA